MFEAGAERPVVNLPFGSHVGLIYTSREEWGPVIALAVQVSLDRDERWIHVADDQSARCLGSALQAAGVDVTGARRQGALLFVSGAEWRESNSGESRGMGGVLRRRIDDALTAGFAGLRVTVEMTELLATMDDPRQWQSYQVAVNSIVPRSQSSCIFLYDRSRLSPSRLRAVLHTHPLVVLQNRLYPNIYHEPPDAALDESSQIHHLNAMIDQIRRLETPGISASTEKLVADRDALSHFLATVPIFEDLPRGVIDQLVEIAPLRRHRRGQFIFLEGEPIATIHVLVEGHVKMIRETEDGREVILRVVGPGEVFGIAGFGGEQVQRFSAQANEDAAVIDIPTAEFIRLLSASPRCLQATFQTVGTLLRDIESRICDLQTKGAESRLAGTLVRLAAGSPEALSRQPRTALALTRQDLADLAGTNLSTASRAVNAWARVGLISLGRARIAVLDERALREIAQGIKPFEHVGMSAEKAYPRPTSLLRR